MNRPNHLRALANGADLFEGEQQSLRFFAGLDTEDTAAAMDISPRTVKREWALAKAWLDVLN